MRRLLFILLFVTMTLVSCEKEKVYGRHKVLIMYSAGFNNLSRYLIGDIEELEEGLVYPKYSSKGAIVIFGRHTRDNFGSNPYSPEIGPCLIHLYQDTDGVIVKDTLLTFPNNTKAADKETMHQVLTYIKKEFPSQHYGMIFSSHATGWLPEGYYSDPIDEENSSVWGSKKKSIGADYEIVDGKRISHEMELTDMAKAIPMKLDYLLFDMCLMGGIEVAYELRNVCEKIGFSQAEVLADGYNYLTIAENLIDLKASSPEQVCIDYYTQYANQTGVYQSATISLVKTSELEPLAVVCKNLFEKYRTQILTLDKNSVQRYFRFDYHWFYDLKSIIIEAGATEQELAELQAALDRCVIYKAATPNFMIGSGGFPINIHSGFSMYLPNENWHTLNAHYKTLEWNKATELVNF